MVKLVSPPPGAAHKGKKVAGQVIDQVADRASVVGALPDMGPSAFDRVASTTNTLTTYAYMGLPLGAGALNLLGKGSRKLFGEKNVAGRVLSAPSNFLASPLGKVGEQTRTAGFFSRMGERVLTPLANTAESVGNTTGLNKWRSNRHTQKAATLVSETNALVGDLRSHTALPQHLIEHVDAIGHAVSNSHGTDLAATVGKLSGAGIEIKKGLGVIGKELDGEIKAAKAIADKALRASALKPLEERAASLGALGKQIGKLEEVATKAVRRTDSAKSLGTVVKGLGGEIKAATVSHTLQTGALLAADTLAVADTARGFAHDFSNLRQMCADMQGVKPEKISNFKLMFGKLPEPAAKARTAMLGEHGVQGFIRMATLAFGIKSARKPMGGMTDLALRFLAPQALAVGAGALLGSKSTIDAYKTLSTAQKAGQQISAEDYAVFVTMSVPQCKDRKGGVNNPVIQALTAQYAAEGITPAEILNESGNGKLNERIKGITAAADAQKVSAVDAAASKPSFAERVSGNAKGMTGEVVGSHTKTVVENAQAAALQPGGRPYP